MIFTQDSGNFHFLAMPKPYIAENTAQCLSKHFL